MVSFLRLHCILYYQMKSSIWMFYWHLQYAQDQELHLHKQELLTYSLLLRQSQVCFHLGIIF